MSKDVAKTQSTELAEVGMDAFGESQVSSQDIVIPKILCMQGLSKLVIDGEAKFGDFIDSMTNEVVGDMKNPVAFIPFHLEKIMIISKKNGDKFEFDRVEQINASNENLPYQQSLNGFEYKNEKVMNFYSILPSDTSIPYIVSFKGMSSKTGRALATQMYIKNKAAGKVPPAKVMLLGGEKTTNDKGTFVTLNTKIQGESSNEQIHECLKWFKVIQSGKAKAHDDIQQPQAEESSQF